MRDGSIPAKFTRVSTAPGQTCGQVPCLAVPQPYDSPTALHCMPRSDVLDSTPRSQHAWPCAPQFGRRSVLEGTMSRKYLEYLVRTHQQLYPVIAPRASEASRK